MDVVERIFNLVAESGIEQKEFARLVGVTDKIASAWHTGRSKSYTKHLSRIAEVLGTTVNYLLSGEKEEPIAQDDGLTPKERDLIERFRKLSPEGQMYVLGVAQATSDMQENKK